MLWWLSPGEGRDELKKRAQLLKIKAQESSIWTKGCILTIVCLCVGVCVCLCRCVCVI